MRNAVHGGSSSSRPTCLAQDADREVGPGPVELEYVQLERVEPAASIAQAFGMTLPGGGHYGDAGYPKWTGDGRSLLLADRCVPDGPRGLVVFSLETGESSSGD